MFYQFAHDLESENPFLTLQICIDIRVMKFTVIPTTLQIERYEAFMALFSCLNYVFG